MYEFHKGIKTGSDWSLLRAEAILQNWERQFAAVRNFTFVAQRIIWFMSLKEFFLFICKLNFT